VDTWKFYDITHREHVVCNPTSEEKLARLVGLLRLPPVASVVDIACGKGEFLIRLVEAFSNVEAGERRGLDLVHTLVSGQDDWDKYEGLQWYATAEYARTHPDDPDLPELLQRVAKNKAVYLQWGRDTVGWAIYVFRRRTTEGARCAATA
jgi:hypothetical protein